MKINLPAILLPTLAASLGLVSCAPASRFSQMADNLIHPPTVKVVQVRVHDLKKLPSGQEKALAFEGHHTGAGSFWFSRGPVDFKEPTLPKVGGEMDGSLLPPKFP